MKLSFPVYRDDEITPYDMEEIDIPSSTIKRILLDYFGLDYIAEYYRDHSFNNYDQEEIDELSDAYSTVITTDNFIDVIKSDDDYGWLLTDLIDELDWNSEYEELKDEVLDIYRQEVR